MQTLLNDIELDIQELKCLMQAISGDTNPALRIVARRSIQQMKTRLDALEALLADVPVKEIPTIPAKEMPAKEVPVEEIPAKAVLIKESPIEEVPVAIVEPIKEEQVTLAEEIPSVELTVVPLNSSILAERIKPSSDLRHAISLNDSFRFTRELFDGDASRMNEVVRRLGNAPTLNEAMAIFALEVRLNEENEAVADFIELLKKHFN